MRNSCTLFLLLATFSLSAQHFSNRKVLRLLKDIPIFEQAHIAFRLEPLYGDKPIAAYQDTHYMTPASNTKLFTFLAAIQEFDSLPALAYFQENDSLIHFKSTGYPLLFHPFYQDDSLASFFNQKKFGITTLQKGLLMLMDLVGLGMIILIIMQQKQVLSQFMEIQRRYLEILTTLNSFQNIFKIN